MSDETVGRGTPDAAVDRAVKLWDTVRPFVITGRWAGIKDDEEQAIERFIDAMDDLGAAPQDVPRGVLPTEDEPDPAYVLGAAARKAFAAKRETLAETIWPRCADGKHMWAVPYGQRDAKDGSVCACGASTWPPVASVAGTSPETPDAELPRTASDIMRPEHRRIRHELAAQIVALLAEPENPDVGWGIYYDLLIAAFPSEAHRALIAERLRASGVVSEAAAQPATPQNSLSGTVTGDERHAPEGGAK